MSHGTPAFFVHQHVRSTAIGREMESERQKEMHRAGPWKGGVPGAQRGSLRLETLAGESRLPLLGQLPNGMSGALAGATRDGGSPDATVLRQQLHPSQALQNFHQEKEEEEECESDSQQVRLFRVEALSVKDVRFRV